ncbi:flagellar basal body-associated FliL family protein [Cognatishimia sp. WU-CL00825]|uniref:flagellar basal body-associated FliL family protein n=1 Tax=Cognatishimia sp. WU-CL00825 TaxID=3127658 RepID=UPI003106738D
MKFLWPVILLIIGVGAGVGAGLMTAKPPPEMAKTAPCGDGSAVAHVPASTTSPDPTDADLASREFVKLNNQFVVPVVENETVASLVVISLSLEIEGGQRETVFAREPKLRDAFLQVMFDHANLGGFSGAFTDTQTLDRLRRALFDVALHILGPMVTEVLIQDIARQDV